MDIVLNSDDAFRHMASVTYEYANNGRIVARTANGVRQTFA